MPQIQHASDAEHLFAQGRAGDALRSLERVRRDPARAPVESQVLLAEVLVAAGYEDEAWALATRLDQAAGLAKTLKARCKCVIGRLLYLRGRLQEALSTYRSAARIAEGAGDPVRRAVAELGMLSIASDTWSTGATQALGKEVRRSVIRVGDPRLLAELHIRLARHEAMHGNVDVATRHLRVATSLLRDHPQELTQALLKTVESSVFGLASSDQRAPEAARTALAFARSSGSRYFEKLALANLAEMSLKKGNTASSQDYLDELRRIPGSLADAHVAVLDTTAQAKLLEGDHEECERLCNVIDELLCESDAEVPTWYRVATRLTRIHLARRRGEWSRARDLTAAAEELATLRNDRLYTALFRALKLEASVRAGDGLRDVAFLVDPPTDLPHETAAEILRVRGRCFAALGLLPLAAAALERALVIHHLLQAAPARAEALTEYRSLAARDAADGAATVAGSAPQLAQGPTRASVRSRALTGEDLPALLDLPPATPAIFERLVALLDYAGQPDVLGHEALLLLVEHRAARAVALVCRPQDNPVDVAACAGWTERSALQKAAQPEGLIVIPLGTWRETPYELLVDPSDDLGSRLTVAAVARLVGAVRRLEAYRREERERESLWPPEAFEDDAQEVFVSSEMIDLVKTARRIAPTTLPVLLTGETGTGKEIIARLIHRASPRASKPFLPFNCTALPRDLIESQLFGHRRGAFTGAHEAFAGLVRSAAGGTLFLDEIGELAADLQPKLLRFLETSEVHPIGEAHPVRVDVRIIAATNANLERLLEQGRFREDLFYRLSVMRLRIPPLRERREEIPALVQHFIRRAGQEFHKGEPRVTEDALEYLVLFSWPGNVRELANELRRIVNLLEPDGTITPAHLSPHIRAARRTIPADDGRPGHELTVRLDQPLPKVIEAVERLMISRALDAAGGRMEQAARLLGISRKGLFLKRRRWNLHAPPSGRSGRAARAEPVPLSAQRAG